MTYEFSRLSGHDFECLIRDLFEAEFDVRIEHFTAGRDGGIELRYAPVVGNGFLVQAMRYSRTKFSGLKSKLKAEQGSLKKLGPIRLVLATLHLGDFDCRERLPGHRYRYVPPMLDSQIRSTLHSIPGSMVLGSARESLMDLAVVPVLVER